MKKNYTFKLDTDLMDQLSLRAGAEVRSLANFIELVFKAAINTVPASLPVLIIEAQDVPKDKVKRNTIKKVKEQPREAINEDTCILQVSAKKYTFDGKLCHYKSFTDQPKQLLLTDDMIELGKVKGATARTFSRFPDPSTFAIVTAYLNQ
jgi:hypothetical protein